METKQPVWKLLANLGDVHPLDYGGYFIYVDTTGVYPPEAELLEVPENQAECTNCQGVGGFQTFDKDGDYSGMEDCSRCGGTSYDGNEADNTIYRFELTRCTLQAGILSDNQYHPEHEAWFAKHLESIASTADLPDIADLLCSEDPLDRARAYQAIGEYHGFDNLDSYPLKLSRNELKARYTNGELR